MLRNIRELDGQRVAILCLDMHSPRFRLNGINCIVDSVSNCHNCIAWLKSYLLLAPLYVRLEWLSNFPDRIELERVQIFV